MNLEQIARTLARRRLKMNPPLDGAELARFEADHRVQLPEEYRRFLLEIGNGGAGPGEGLHRLAEAYPGKYMDLERPFVLSRPTSLRPVEKRSKFDFRRFAEGTDLEDGCLEICHHGCCNYTLLVVTGEERGRVWMNEAAGVVYPNNQSFLEWYWEWLEEK